MSPTDYARTPYAQANRQAKVRALSQAAWDAGATGDDVAGWDPARRRELARQVDVNPPTDPGDTWPAVVADLDARAAWAAANPSHPRAARACDVVLPRGWAERVAAWPPLERPDARCARCKEPAITATPGTWRCAKHPPQPGEWGALLDWTPKAPPTGCGQGRCYCTRCPTFQPT